MSHAETITITPTIKFICAQFFKRVECTVTPIVFYLGTCGIPEVNT